MSPLTEGLNYRSACDYHLQRWWHCFQQCPFVCLFVCERNNSRTVRDIITKFSGHHPRVKRVDKFENGWRFNVLSVLVLQLQLSNVLQQCSQSYRPMTMNPWVKYPFRSIYSLIRDQVNIKSTLKVIHTNTSTSLQSLLLVLGSFLIGLSIW